MTGDVQKDEVHGCQWIRDGQMQDIRSGIGMHPDTAGTSRRGGRDQDRIGRSAGQRTRIIAVCDGCETTAYSSKILRVITEIFQQTKKGVEPKNILLDAILIREVKLPLTLQEAIERKLKEEQASLEYEFKLTREKQEAERIIIEANAKAEANRILSSSLTDRILQDKGIDATLELANSPNSKVIVVGSGDKGLPLILGSGN